MSGERILEMVRFTFLVDGKWHKLTASEQRSIFDAVIFENAYLRFDTCRNEFAAQTFFGLGGGCYTRSYSLNEIAQMISMIQADANV